MKNDQDLCKVAKKHQILRLKGIKWASIGKTIF